MNIEMTQRPCEPSRIQEMDRPAVRRMIGRRLRVMRVEKQFRTTTELSTAIEKEFGAVVDPRLLYALEMGEGECEVEVWLILAEIYDTDLRELAGRDLRPNRVRNSGTGSDAAGETTLELRRLVPAPSARRLEDMVHGQRVPN